MNEQEYLSERLEDQIEWYGTKSKHNQIWFKILSLFEMMSAALVAFLSGVGNNTWIVGSLGILIAVSAATSSLFKFHENWIQYRTTSEQLKHEKFLYLTNIKPYDSENKFPVLVERIEGLISKENSYWAQSTEQITKNNKII